MDNISTFNLICAKNIFTTISQKTMRCQSRKYVFEGIYKKMHYNEYFFYASKFPIFLKTRCTTLDIHKVHHVFRIFIKKIKNGSIEKKWYGLYGLLTKQVQFHWKPVRCGLLSMEHLNEFNPNGYSYYGIMK